MESYNTLFPFSFWQSPNMKQIITLSDWKTATILPSESLHSGPFFQTSPVPPTQFKNVPLPYLSSPAYGYDQQLLGNRMYDSSLLMATPAPEYNQFFQIDSTKTLTFIPQGPNNASTFFPSPLTEGTPNCYSSASYSSESFSVCTDSNSFDPLIYDACSDKTNVHSYYSFDKSADIKTTNAPIGKERKKHRVSKEKCHVCPVCSHKSRRRHNLLEHMQTHDPNRPKKFHCGSCNRAFARKYDMKRHEKIHLR